MKLVDQIIEQEQVVDDWLNGRRSWWNLHAVSDSPNKHAESAQHDLAQVQIEIQKLAYLRSQLPNPVVKILEAIEEQQRIANLIGIVKISGGNYALEAHSALFQITPEGFSSSYALQPEIKEALGL